MFLLEGRDLLVLLAQIGLGPFELSSQKFRNRGDLPRASPNALERELIGDVVGYVGGYVGELRFERNGVAPSALAPRSRADALLFFDRDSAANRLNDLEKRRGISEFRIQIVLLDELRDHST